MRTANSAINTMGHFINVYTVGHFVWKFAGLRQMNHLKPSCINYPMLSTKPHIYDLNYFGQI